MKHYNEQEVWKDIPDYEGLYQASTLGQIKSIKNSKDKILKQSFSGLPNKKYNIVCLYKNDIRRTMKVHSLIAITFLNHIQNGMRSVIDHIDNNRLNNRKNNLRIITNGENIYKGIMLRSGLPYGVSINKKRFTAKIQINLGFFNTAEEASLAYQSALSKIQNNGI